MPDKWEVDNNLQPTNGADNMTDADSDGLLNLYEYGNSTDPQDNDTDNDGLNDYEEIVTHGTDPNDNDSDDDGMPDGWEANNGLAPLNNADNMTDADSDNLLNLYEYGNSTDPQDNDTDNDGLNDYEEIITHGTDPTDNDSDNDGMPDGWELNNGLAPLNSADNMTDADSDGLLNLYEYGNSTDPQDTDTDNDGLNDYEEVATHGTDPNDTDTDNDNMPDKWEVDNSLQPTNGADNLTDADSDGLLNLYEYGNSTDPQDPDSDDDGMPDGWELNNGLAPLNNADNMTDADSDGLLNLYEYGNSTNPQDNDTDNDGLNDYEEITTHGTDPTDNDSDNDGMPDGWELNNGLAPLNNTDKLADADSDGLLNLYEYGNSTDPHDNDTDNDGLNDYEEIVSHGTDPNDNDSDDDGMPDGWEANNGLAPLNNADNMTDADSDGLLNLYEYGNSTNPQDSDTDNDGLNDYEEIITHGTDPTDNDSDNDGMPDGWELNNGLAPLNSADKLADADSDGLLNLYEYGNNTDPQDGDTDNDNMPDKWEVDNSLQPTNGADNLTDADLDNLLNIFEYGNSTDPQDNDTDNDGLNDYEEIITHGTDPNDNDSDNDEMPDGWEANNGLAPLNGADKLTDADSDGLLNLYEYGNNTDPQDSDTDDDNMPDKWEIDNNLQPTNGADNMSDADTDGIANVYEYGNSTDPQDTDSDDDLLDDYQEIVNYGTDPNKNDTDNDNLTDYEEIFTYFTNPNDDDSDNDGLLDGYECKVVNTSPNNNDTDNDGLDDREEIINGVDGYITDPNNNDTDNDNMPDGWESIHLLNPTDGSDDILDADSDNLLNIYEFGNNTDPQDSDTDNDYIDDYQEIISGVDGFITNPTNNDTDYDGMPDGWEVQFSFNPTSAVDNKTDPDLDGLINVYEYGNNTDPTDEDTDNDNIPDGWETKYGLNPTSIADKNQDPDSDNLGNYDEYSSNTNPLDADTDDDGMPDGWEVNYNLDPNLDDSGSDPDGDTLTNIQEYQYSTDPRNADTDGDGYPDNVEINSGTDPLDPNSNIGVIITYILIIGAIASGGVATVFIIKKTKKRRPNFEESAERPEKPEGHVWIFFSYNSKDAKAFRIQELADGLKQFDDIDEVLVWESKTKDNIITYMDYYVGRSDALVLFCSKNSQRSVAVNKEWQAAEAIHKPVIPIFMDFDTVPTLLKARIGVEFKKDDFLGTVVELHEIIMRKIKKSEATPATTEPKKIKKRERKIFKTEDSIKQLIEIGKNVGIPITEVKARQFIAEMERIQAEALESGQIQELKKEEELLKDLQIQFLQLEHENFDEFKMHAAIIGISPSKAKELSIEFSSQMAILETTHQQRFSSKKMQDNIEFINRIHFINCNRNQVISSIQRIVKEKVQNLSRKENYTLIGVTFGTYPFNIKVGNDIIAKDTPILWTDEEIINGVKKVEDENSRAHELKWDDFSSMEPGWIRFEWVFIENNFQKLIRITNLVEITYQARKNEEDSQLNDSNKIIQPLDIALKYYTMENHDNINKNPLTTMDINQMHPKKVDQYLNILKDEIKRYLKSGKENYGKILERIYMCYKFEGEYLFTTKFYNLFYKADIIRQLLSNVDNYLSFNLNNIQENLELMEKSLSQILDSLMEIIEIDIEIQLMKNLNQLLKGIKKLDKTITETEFQNIIDNLHNLKSLINKYYFNLMQKYPKLLIKLDNIKKTNE